MFIKDVAEAIYQADVLDITGVLNVGTGQAIEILELVKTVAKFGPTLNL